MWGFFFIVFFVFFFFFFFFFLLRRNASCDAVVMTLSFSPIGVGDARQHCRALDHYSVWLEYAQQVEVGGLRKEPARRSLKARGRLRSLHGRH